MLQVTDIVDVGDVEGIVKGNAVAQLTPELGALNVPPVAAGVMVIDWLPHGPPAGADVTE